MTGPYGGSLQFWNYGGDGWGSKFIITDNGNVGIGTSNPQDKLRVEGTASCNALYVASGGKVGIETTTPKLPLDWMGRVGFGPYVTGSPLSKDIGQGLFLQKQDGTFESEPTLYSYYDIGCRTVLRAPEGSLNLESSDTMYFSVGTYKDLIMIDQSTGNVGIGTSNPSNKLDVLGTIRAEEVIVETGWADYVFEKDYIRMGLDELETYITQRGRLPGIPTEEEVKENGIGLGELQVKLLQKIEELTLYLIDQKKEINRLQNEIAELKGT